ncbi:MAG: family serine peptidase, partial [Chloroflexota bacterium]|nr:family serine peptidase [Chloroflexota bacterium]
LEIVVEDARLETAADDFDPNTGYAGSDGGLPWLDPWLEVGETDGPTAGLVRAEISTKCTTGACLRIPALGADAIRRGVERGVNLTGATAAVLSFAFRQSGRTGQVDLEASGDGGAHWSRLKSYIVTTASANPTRQSVSLLPHAAPDTRIRFIGAGGAGDGILYVDNVRVDAVRQGIGGQVWDDLNRDGSQAMTEPGLRGITVKLHHSTCAAAAGPAYRTTVTGDDGYYAFTPLAVGVYCARPDTATLPAGYTLTSAAAAREVTLAAAQFYDAADFGYAVAAAPDRLLVAAYAPCTDATWLQQIAQTYGATIIGQNPATCGYTVQVAPANQAALQAAINADAHTRRADPDTWAHTAFTPNDPDYQDPWLVYGPRAIHADAAWDVTRGDPNIIIAILDSGLDLTHPEFAGRIVPGYDFVNNDSDPTDDQTHGTHVSGIAAAGIHNGIGMAGIAGDARILPVKALNNKGTGWWSDIARGITWAVDQGARVLNLSLAGTTYSQALYDAIAYANSKGAVVIVAAGNNGMSAPTYPASFDNVIAVGGSDYDGLRMALSNYGVNVDVMAPGDSIWSAYPPGGYGYLSGTSMAAPHAAGVAALLLSVNPNLTPDQIKDTLQTTATDMDAPGVDIYTGYGLINAGAAVAAVTPAVFVTPTTSLAATLAGDLNANGLVDPGDTLRYLITVANPGATPLANAVVSATVPLYTSYVISSARLSGIPVRDDAAPQTALPLDAGGLNIGSVPAHGSTLVSFDVVVGQLPRGVYVLVGQATVTAGGSPQALQVVTPVAGTLLQVAVDRASAQISQTLTYSLTSAYLGSDLLSNVVVTAAVPAGTSYVAGSANAGGTLSSGTPGDSYAPLPGTAGFDPGVPGNSGTLTTTTTPGDTYIDQFNPDNNYEATLRVHVLPNVSNARQRVGLLKFDLSGVPAGVRVDSATLTARVQRLTTAWDARIYRLLTAWTETGATWNDADGTGPGAWASGAFSTSDYDAAQPYGPLDVGLAAPPAVDVTGLARSWVESGLPNHGVALIGSAQNINRAELYDSEDAGLEPKLTLNWSIPAEP